MNQNDVDVDNLELANTRSRIKAFVIDDILISTVVIILMWEQIQATPGDLGSVLMVMNQAFFQVILMKFIYQTFFIWYYGATLGKMAAKIRVIDYDNFSKVGFDRALMRAVMRIVSESIFYIGFLLFFYTDSKQTLHDKVAKTLVVNA
jgi:uncharacterized RDD family membrane protein YckC